MHCFKEIILKNNILKFLPIILFVSCLEEFPEYIPIEENFFEKYNGVVWENVGWEGNSSETEERYLTFTPYENTGNLLTLAYIYECSENIACSPSCDFIRLGYDGNYITYSVTQQLTPETFILDVETDDNVSFQYVFSVGISSDLGEETLIRYLRNGIDSDGSQIDLSNEPITRFRKKNNLTDPCNLLL